MFKDFQLSSFLLVAEFGCPKLPPPYLLRSLKRTQSLAIREFIPRGIVRLTQFAALPLLQRIPRILCGIMFNFRVVMFRILPL